MVMLVSVIYVWCVGVTACLSLYHVLWGLNQLCHTADAYPLMLCDLACMAFVSEMARSDGGDAGVAMEG